MHLLTAYAHEAGVVLAQPRVDAKTNARKTALGLLDLLLKGSLEGKVMARDAMGCQPDLSK